MKPHNAAISHAEMSYNSNWCTAPHTLINVCVTVWDRCDYHVTTAAVQSEFVSVPLEPSSAGSAQQSNDSNELLLLSKINYAM